MIITACPLDTTASVYVRPRAAILTDIEFLMDCIIELLAIFAFSMECFIQSAPIHNGLSVRFNPIFIKEDLVPKTFGALFAKIPQEVHPKDELQKDILSKGIFPNSTVLGKGCSNQIAKIKLPKHDEYNISGSIPSNSRNPMNLPLIQQPYKDYNILVATAPPNVKLGPDGKDLVVYVVFPNDSSNPVNPFNIPRVYFVNSKIEDLKKEPIDSEFIIDSNRTVTGLKSNAVSKFVRFKGKSKNQIKELIKGQLKNQTNGKETR